MLERKTADEEHLKTSSILNSFVSVSYAFLSEVTKDSALSRMTVKQNGPGKSISMNFFRNKEAHLQL